MSADNVFEPSKTATLAGTVTDSFGPESELRLQIAQLRRELVGSKERLSQMEGVFANTADAIIVVEYDGQIIDANPAACSLFGYTIQEFRALFPWDFVTSASREEILATIKRVEDGKPLSVQRVCRSKNGQELTVALRLARHALSGRRLVVVTGRDVSQEQRAAADLENALKEIRRSEIELRAIVDALPAHAWCSRADGYNIFCNQQWLDYSGLTQESARGWSYRDIIHPDDINPYTQKWNEVSLAETRIEAEARFRRQDGEYRWFLIQAVPVRDERGNILKWFGTNTDIDDLKRAEAILAAENRILEMVAAGQPLSETLVAICRLVDGMCPESKTSISLLDEATNTLRVAAGPRLQAEYLACVDGLKIGPDAGICGTAAFRKEQVIVSDVQSDPLCEAHRELAARFKIGAGWSTPINASNGAVVGVFCVYWEKPRTVLPTHSHIMAQTAHLASVAIERQLAIEAVRASERSARAQAEALRQTLDAISHEGIPDRMLDHVLRAMVGQLDGFGCYVWLAEQNSESMSFEFAFEKGKFKTKADSSFPTPSTGSAWPWPDVFRSHNAIVVADMQNGYDFPWRQHLLMQGIVSMLVVPLFVAGKTVGVIGTCFKEQRSFRMEELELAQALANQAMLAIQLIRQAQQNREAAVVAERNRFARDIHDTLAQGFTGVIVQLEAASGAVNQGNLNEVAKRVESASDLARFSLNEARRSVRALRPHALREGTLEAAIKGILKRMTEGISLQAEFAASTLEQDLAADVEEIVLRITQEALTNTIKHARAATFKVTLLRQGTELQLRILDDGRGFNPVEEHDGFGLIGMRERVNQIGGVFSIHSAIGQGTEIQISLPSQIS